MKKFVIAIVLIILLVHPRWNYVTESRAIGLTVEFATGTCLDSEQNGRLHNGEPFYNYISYKGTSAKANEDVLTVFIYNPLTTYEDDILLRFDWVITEGRLKMLTWSQFGMLVLLLASSFLGGALYGVNVRKEPK